MLTHRERRIYDVKTGTGSINEDHSQASASWLSLFSPPLANFGLGARVGGNASEVCPHWSECLCSYQGTD